MNEIRRTPLFDQWLDGLKDKQGQHRIQARILRLGLGLMGDVKPVREGVSELRIDSGPGYRVYFTRQGQTLVFLLAGGDNSPQEKDIRAAIELAKHL